MKFQTENPIQVRLSATFLTAVGLPAATDVPLYGAAVEDGWLLADYRNGDGTITRYAVPPEHVIYVRQTQAESVAQAPARVR